MNMVTNLDKINRSKRLCKNRPISISAFVDLIILIVVIFASGFLLYPYAAVLVLKTFEVISSPVVYGVLGLVTVTIFMVMLGVMLCKGQTCGQPGCRGLRKPVEFDIKVETADSIKSCDPLKCGFKKGLYELPRDYCRELEAQLKKMAPANGRVVLVFRGRCGCPFVQVEVPGPKKNNRKMKK